MSAEDFPDKLVHALECQLTGLQVQDSPDLVERLRDADLLAELDVGPRRPVLRLVHHFACTGGTLISKCIASMPCIQLLSEVDPLSTLGPAAAFIPTDLIGLARRGSNPPSRQTLARIFLAGLSALEDDARAMGQDLVLRDHNHSHFCVDSDTLDRPTLRELLAPNYQLLSLATVRHPLDSFLSLQRQKWLHFKPDTLEEYARRYHQFLDRHENVEIMRYEDFVDDPEGLMPQLCEILKLPYNPDFINLYSVQKLSGDSGRSGTAIGRRKRQQIPDAVMAMLVEAPTYERLCERLGYEAAS